MPETRINWWNIHLDENDAQAAADAIRNRCVSQGARTARLEAELARRLEVPFVVCTTSGTSALLMAYLAAGLTCGDDIVVPNRTALATAHAAMLLGGRVRTVDVRPEAQVIDEDRIEAALTGQTRILVPVHMNGKACDMDKVMAIAERHHLVVVEDACQALFSRSRGRCLGTRARFGCFSLGLAKMIAVGQGGAVCCHTRDDYDLLRSIRNQGVNEDHPELSYRRLAGNFKFNDVLASVGLSQLDKTEQKIRSQIAIHERYREGLASLRSVRFVPVDVAAGEVPLRAECLATEKDRLIEDLKQYQIHTISHIPSFNTMPHLRQPGAYPHSDLFAAHLMLLPCGPDQPLGHIDRVIDVLHTLDSRYRPW